jgi:class 3 adenylate cyclase/tetratricopeptide (TPR) repeat protein
VPRLSAGKSGKGARFCNGCGTRLTAAAQAAAPRTYTPAHLAEKILTSRSAMVGERKQVTVLFADLKGSMELLADRDPEEARRPLDAVLERMMEAVHRYEGTVNQVMGDGIMALFGAPVAHEDHAVRACYAALRMQETVGRYAEQAQRAEGISVKIRVGLNSGEVVVRAIGSDLHMDYTAVGQTTHLAARMEQMAEPGSVLVAPSTLRLAGGAVQVTPLGARTVKGLDQAIEVSALVGGAPARSKARTTDAQQLSRFVGRTAELDHLHRLLELARAGQGQVVAVSAEAGVGSSTNSSGRRSSRAGSSTAGRSPTSGPRPTCPSSRCSGPTSSWMRAIPRRAWPSAWRRPSATSIPASPTRPRRSCRSSTRCRRTIPSTRSTASGNPFFLEEIVRALVETRVLVGERGAYRLVGDLGALQVPPTIQAVLAARIDRLPLDEKLLLQSASVIGSDVPQALLEAIAEVPAERVGQALTSLRNAGFLYEASLFPDVVYRLKSALTRDVAYASLLREQRRVHHARIVEAIERLYHDRRTSRVDQLAFHASRGEVWAKALPYNRQVGMRAVLHAANAEAVRAFQDALAALRHLPETRETIEAAIDLRLDLRPPLLQLGRLEEVLTVSREAERLATSLGDEQRLARVYTYLINRHYLKGETREAIEYGQRCLAVGRSTDDTALQGLARQYMGQSYHARGDYTQAERTLREDIEVSARDQATTSYVASCSWLAFSLADRGAFDAAAFYLAEAQRAAETTQHAYSRLIAWTLIGLVWIRRGRLARAVLPLERAMEACRRKHLTVWLPIPLSLLGLAFVRMGHIVEGLRLLEESVTLSRELGVRAYLSA